MKSKNPLRLILLSGLLVGTLDILAACISYYITTGKGPEGVLRYVASGVFGKEAFTAGNAMMFWGLFFHFIIAYSFTILFYFLYIRLSIIRKAPILTAVCFGVFMWAVTTQIVLPLSKVAPAQPLQFWKIIRAILILIFMISLPLTLIMKSNYTPTKVDY